MIILENEKELDEKLNKSHCKLGLGIASHMLTIYCLEEIWIIMLSDIM